MPQTLAADPAFGKARQKLSDALGGVVVDDESRCSTIPGTSSRWMRRPPGRGSLESGHHLDPVRRAVQRTREAPPAAPVAAR